MVLLLAFLLIFLLLRAVEATARRLGSRALAESGNYYVHGGGEPSTRVWALQCAVFVLITLISKCMLALVLIPLAKPLGQFGLFFAQPLREHPEIELVWYDYSCMPQGVRTALEQLEIRQLSKGLLLGPLRVLKTKLCAQKRQVVSRGCLVHLAQLESSDSLSFYPTLLFPVGCPFRPLC